MEWSGQYENETRARERLKIVIPAVLFVIYFMLYLTYRSFLDAAQVLLAVPFALAGGIYLLYALSKQERLLSENFILFSIRYFTCSTLSIFATPLGIILNILASVE